MQPKRYGPYKGKYGHLFWKDEYPDGRRKTVWVHREMMEQHLGRKLDRREVVHHKNGKPDDNRIANFEVKSLSQHSKDHHPLPEMIEVECAGCGKKVQKHARFVRHNLKQGKAGPFCGRACAGRRNIALRW